MMKKNRCSIANGLAVVSFLCAQQTLAAPEEVFDHHKIADGVGGLGGGTLANGDYLGSSCTVLGDLDGDGVPELVVGANGDDTREGGGGENNGAVHILFLNANGTVRSGVKIADGVGGLAGGTFANNVFFGFACTVLGDLDGDGISELVVGAPGDGGGALHILFLNADGTVRSDVKIADGVGGLAGGTLANLDSFGSSCAVLGDLDGDGVPELAVGAYGDDTRDGGGGNANGALHILFLNVDGTVRTQEKIADGVGGLAGGTLANLDGFGSSSTVLGDLDGDGVPELAVGAAYDNTREGGGGIYNGAIHMLFLNADGTVRSQKKIADGVGGLAGGTVANAEFFGSSCTVLGDLDGDGVPELAVGAIGDSTREGGGGLFNGAVHILSLGDLPIEVTTEHDENDGSGSGVGRSLREAIAEAKATGEFRSITFAEPLNGKTITLGGTQLDITSQAVKISARSLPDGITISGNDASRVFQIDRFSVVTLECLTLRDGSPPQGSFPTDEGGAIFNNGVLSVLDCWLTANNEGAFFNGGSGDNIGQAKLVGTTISGNTSGPSDEAGLQNAAGNLVMLNCTVADNVGSLYGAIYCSDGGTTELRHVTVTNNTSPGRGGGIYVESSGVTVSVVNSIIAGNSAVTEGTDLYFAGGSSAITASGMNLIGSNETVETEFPESALVGTAQNPLSAGLGPLDDYGGKTPTMPLLAESLAIDMGDFFPLPETDQCGEERVQDGYPDLGAVEGIYTPPPPSAPVIAMLPDTSAAKAVLSKKIKKLKKKLKNAKRKKQVAKAKKFKGKIKKLTKRLRAL